MPTIIDQLVVTLELDSSKFDAGIQKALGGLKALGMAADHGIKVQFSTATEAAKTALVKTGDVAEETGTKVQRGMGRGAMGIFVLTAAVYKLNEAIGLPAIRRMTQDTVDSETETYRFAKSLHLNAQELQAWGKTVQLHGGDVHSFNAGIEKMEANLGKLGTKVRGAKILQQYLGLAGVTDDMVRAKDAFSVLTLFAQQMQGMSVERQFLVGKRLGLDEATIRTLQEGGPAVLAQVQAMRELAATQEELQNAKDVAVAQAQANLQWERAKQVISAAFLPSLKALAEKLEAVSKWIRENQAAVVFYAKVVGVAISALAAGVFVLAAAWTASAIAAAFATGGLSVAAGAAALAAVGITAAGAAALLSAQAFKETGEAHADMVDTILTGDKKLDAAAATRKRALEIQATHKKNLESLAQQVETRRNTALSHLSERDRRILDAARAYSTPEGLEKKKQELTAKDPAVAAGLKVLERMTARYGLADYHLGREIDQQFLLNPKLAGALQQQIDVKNNTFNIYTSTGQVDFTWNGKDILATPGTGLKPPQVGRAMH
jgi:hypothetical protein